MNLVRRGLNFPFVEVGETNLIPNFLLSFHVEFLKYAATFSQSVNKPQSQTAPHKPEDHVLAAKIYQP